MLTLVSKFGEETSLRPEVNSNVDEGEKNFAEFGHISRAKLTVY